MKQESPKQDSINTYRSLIEGKSKNIDSRLAEDNIDAILRSRTKINDNIVIEIAKNFFSNNEKYISIIAVGGYGREELYPKSDTDLLILIEQKKKQSLKRSIKSFLAFLWDIGIEVSHSTRTLNECLKEGKKDLSIATSLIESRYLFGSNDLFINLEKKIKKNKSFWKNETFLKEKIIEQQLRHSSFNNTAYNLEPNIKNGPGGLRDIHTIFWIAKKIFSINEIEDLEEHKILTKEQIIVFKDSWAFISKIRYHLHKITNRSENRLLFDYQRSLSKEFGYKNNKHLLGVEIFMQDYYKATKSISRLNEISLQILEQKILYRKRKKSIEINKSFEIRNNLIGLKKGISFLKEPSLILEIFLQFQKNKDIDGIEADTINRIVENRYLIDDNFRKDKKNRSLFLDILRAPEGVTHELKRMNLYGVLGLYIPSFGLIEGRMQYDLFHAFTVDEHTLNVVSNLRRLALSRFDHEYPEDSLKMQSIENQVILYISGLYHDIAKGRGGDHSLLGAEEAEEFCLSHGMTHYDSKLVSWLVENHLIFSLTAQKKDIYDPNVIEELAKIIGDENRLDYLYLLTVSDVRATNPGLWNSWKERLFNDLYKLVKNSLRAGLENPIDKEALINEKKELSRSYLRKNNKDLESINSLIYEFEDNYFLKFNQDEINYQMDFLLSRNKTNENHLINLEQSDKESLISLFILTEIKSETFFLITSILEENNLSIRDAKVVQLNNDKCVYNFYIDRPNSSFEEIEQKNLAIKESISRRLENKEEHIKNKDRKLSRQLRSFDTETQINFFTDPINKRTVMELICLDRPALLLDISKVFKNEEIWIESAKIATIGERAEDVFYLKDKEHGIISEEMYPYLEESIIKSIAQS